MSTEKYPDQTERIKRRHAANQLQWFSRHEVGALLDRIDVLEAAIPGKCEECIQRVPFFNPQKDGRSFRCALYPKLGNEGEFCSDFERKEADE